MSERDSGEFPLTFTDDRAPSNGDAEAREIQLAYNGLKIAWINERAAPEILPYQPHIVDKLKLAIDEEVFISKCVLMVTELIYCGS
jgi:hypothetical protein